jgi:outer membrane protein assembly factor BamC
MKFDRAMKAFIGAVLLCGLLAVLVSGCGTVSGAARAIDYRQTKTLPPLDVPPDLSATAVAGRPDGTPGTTGSATYSGYAGHQESRPGSERVLPKHPNVKLAREGQARFVVVNAEPAAVWSEVRDFLTKTGLSIARENASAGLIETDWAENYALVGAPSDSKFARWFKSLFSVGVRDKYRIRLEHGVEPGTTEVYLTHSGMQELAVDDNDFSRGATAGWKPRPRDPELEAEMLHRLVAFLGGERDGDTVIAKAPAEASASNNAPTETASAPSAKLTRDGNGAALLTLEDSLERAWRRVGLSLDRIGFTVEDRDRSKGIYYVRYIDPDNKPEEKGFFARLFSSSEPPPSNQYQVQIRSAENGTNVEVLDKQGEPEASKTGERILSLLYEQLK